MASNDDVHSTQHGDLSPTSPNMAHPYAAKHSQRPCTFNDNTSLAQLPDALGSPTPTAPSAAQRCSPPKRSRASLELAALLAGNNGATTEFNPLITSSGRRSSARLRQPQQPTAPLPAAPSAPSGVAAALVGRLVAHVTSKVVVENISTAAAAAPDAGADGAGAGDAPAAAAAPSSKRRRRTKADTASAAAAPEGAVAAGDLASPPAPAHKRAPRKRAAAASDSSETATTGIPNAGAEEEGADEAAEPPTPAVIKEKRKTKVAIRAEVRADAEGAVFAPLVTQHLPFPHSRTHGAGPIALSEQALQAAREHNRRLLEANAAQAQVRALAEVAAAAEVAAGSEVQGASASDDSGDAAADVDAAAAAEAGKAKGRRSDRRKAAAEAAAAAPAAAAAAALAGPLPAIDHPVPDVIPNLGYACLCATLREHDIYCSRDTTKAGFAAKGLEHISRLALANARDLRLLLEWNEAHGIRFFRISSCVFPWMSFYKMEQLQDYQQIKQAFQEVGDTARRYGHRLTFHPSEFTKIAGERPEVIETSIAELEVQSAMLDLMGFLPATPFNKINIHVGGTYGGDKRAALDRFAEVVMGRLSANCRARLTVENDDRASLYSVADLMYLHRKIGIPIVFDFHHHRFCPGGVSEEEAFRLALSTWPAGVRPVVHWSESQEGRRSNAHSDYITGPIMLYGMEREVDVMIESKAKELALLHYREAALQGRPAVRPALGAQEEEMVAEDG